GTVGGRLGERFLRALEWIGTSMTRESSDDKVVDLITAIECVLDPTTGGSKAEAVTLRSMLLAAAAGSELHNPVLLYRFYLVRNQIVHGSERGLASEGDYLFLRRAALDIVETA